MGRKLRLVLIAAALLALTPALHAQNAVVLGTVYDGTGNPMPGISVLLENPATGFTRIATTAADGSYSIPEVPPADGYVITASKEGATISSRKDISVNVGDERSILPPLREEPATPAAGEPAAAGGAAPTPGPGANLPTPKSAPIVRNETTSTSIGGVITGDQLRTLPLYNRNFLVLGLLTPNTHDVEAGSPLAGASFSIAGQRPTSNQFLLDGADNVASSSNQAIPFQVNDAIQEFRVTSSTANAEYGRAAGGVVSVVTRRGTNQIHGALFGYFANSALNADSPLSVYNGTGFDRTATFAGPTNAVALPPVAGQAVGPTSYNQYVATAQARGFCTNSITAPAGANPATCVAGAQGRNDRFDPAAILAANDSHKAQFDSKQFGANIGGALKKDKIFGFASYEGTRINNPNAVFERVPSAFDRTVRNAADPNYRLANNILGLYPQANVVGVPGVLEFYKGEAPNYTNVHNLLLRSDYSRSERNSFNFRYAGQLLDQMHDATLPETGAYPGNGALRNAQNQNAIATFNHNFSPKLINELRIGFTQFRLTEKAQDRDFDATSLGLPNAALPTILLSGLDTQYSGARAGAAGAFGGWFDSFWATTPSVAMLPTLDGIFPFARIGAPLGAPGQRRDTNYAITNGLTWARGTHSFKFGFEFRYQQNRVVNAGFSRGLIASGNIGEFTSDSETCNTALVGGVACNQAFRAPSFDYALNQQSDFSGLFNSKNFAGYMQDAWRVKKGRRPVTVNVGVRYEYFGVPKEVNNQIWNFDPLANGLVQQGGSTVFDPYGYTCGGGAPFIDAVVRDRTAGQPIQWQCKSSNNGNIVKPDMSDFAGRAGIAWDINGDSRTVLRAGVGIFYDQVPVNYTSQLLYNRPTQLNLANPRYIYGQNFLGSFVANGTTCKQCGMGNASVNPGSLNPLYQSAASPFALYARDTRSSSTPYVRQSNVSLQQQVTQHFTTEFAYVGAAGRRLPLVTNRGFDNEWFCTSTRIPVPGGVNNATQPFCDTFSYFPVFTMANIAESSYHSLMVRGRVAQFHGLRFNATYNWSKSLDNASSGNFPLVPTPLFTQAFGLQFFGLGNPFGFSLGKGGNILGRTAGQIGTSGTIAGSDTFNQSVTTTGAGSIFVTRYNLPQDPYNALTDERGPSDFNNTHRFVIDWNYELPWAKQNKFFGGWLLSGIFSAQSGQPFTVFSGPLFGEVTQRANIVGAVTLTGNPNDYFNGSSSFGLPAASNLNAGPFLSCGYATGAILYEGATGRACTGTSGRNQFTGPAFMGMDMAAQKSFSPFGEGRQLTFRTEVFNLFNRANFYNPNSIVSLDGFNLNPEFGKIKSARDPRQMQFAVRYSF